MKWFVDDVFFSREFHSDEDGYGREIKRWTKLGNFLKDKPESVYALVWVTVAFFWIGHSIIHYVKEIIYEI